mgnify:CR=1 FL=1
MHQFVKTNYYFSSQPSTIDYYPFGQEMPGRVNYASSYRMGFNGQWKDGEFSGTDGGHYEFKFREYDCRIGRFWQVDPLFKDYPWNSTYAFAENDVIRAIDLEGKEKYVKTQGTPGNNDPNNFKLSQDGTSFIFRPLVKPVKSFESEKAVLKIAPTSYERWVNAQCDPTSEYVKRDVVLQTAAGSLLTGGIINATIPVIGTLPKASFRAFSYLNTTYKGFGIQAIAGTGYAVLKEQSKLSPDMPDVDFMPMFDLSDKITTFIIGGIKHANDPKFPAWTQKKDEPQTSNAQIPTENEKASNLNTTQYNWSKTSEKTATPSVSIDYTIKKY